MHIPGKLRKDAKKISVGFHRQCGISKIGQLICWGLHGHWDTMTGYTNPDDANETFKFKFNNDEEELKEEKEEVEL